MRDKLKKAAAQNVALDDELGRWLEENDALKAAILEREKKLQMAPLETNEQLKSAQKALREAQAEGRQMKRDIAKLKAEHESFLVEMKGQIKRLLAENAVEKARAHSNMSTAQSAKKSEASFDDNIGAIVCKMCARAESARRAEF